MSAHTPAERAELMKREGKHTRAHVRGKAVVMTFAMQGWGNLVNTLMILLVLLGQGCTAGTTCSFDSLNLTWRLQYALGAAFLFFLFVGRVSLLKEWSANGLLNMPVIMMSGHATIDTAVDAVKIGAHAFLEKPITLQKLLKAVEQGLARDQVQQAMLAASPPQPPSMLSMSTLVVTENISAPDVHQSFELDRPLREARDAFEKAYFEFHLAHEGGSMTRVAEKTGLERTHLYRKLKQLGVDLTRSKRGH